MVFNPTHSQVILRYKENGGRIEPYTIVIMIPAGILSLTLIVEILFLGRDGILVYCKTFCKENETMCPYYVSDSDGNWIYNNEKQQGICLPKTSKTRLKLLSIIQLLPCNYCLAIIALQLLPCN
jgi:hypothetical protein